MHTLCMCKSAATVYVSTSSSRGISGESSYLPLSLSLSLSAPSFTSQIFPN